MSYPKWRHHPDQESRLVQTAEEEAYLAPDDQGWADTREAGQPDEVPVDKQWDAPWPDPALDPPDVPHEELETHDHPGSEATQFKTDEEQEHIDHPTPEPAAEPTEPAV